MEEEAVKGKDALKGEEETLMCVGGEGRRLPAVPVVGIYGQAPSSTHPPLAPASLLTAATPAHHRHRPRHTPGPDQPIAVPPLGAP